MKEPAGGSSIYIKLVNVEWEKKVGRDDSQHFFPRHNGEKMYIYNKEAILCKEHQWTKVDQGCDETVKIFNKPLAKYVLA